MEKKVMVVPGLTTTRVAVRGNAISVEDLIRLEINRIRRDSSVLHHVVSKGVVQTILPLHLRTITNKELTAHGSPRMQII